MMTKLKVSYGEQLAGYLIEENTAGKKQFSFYYDENYLTDRNARPISVNLPLCDQEYRSETLFPFFDNLLAEGWLLDLQLANYKLDKSDRFALLQHCGLEAMGAVSLRGEDNE